VAPLPGTREPAADEDADTHAAGVPMLALASPVGAAAVSLRAALRVVLDAQQVSVVHLHDPLHSDLVGAIARRWTGFTVASVHEPLPRVGRAAALTAATRDRTIGNIDHWIVSCDDAVESLAAALGKTPQVSIVATGPTTLIHDRPVDPIPGRSLFVVGRGHGDDAAIRAALRDLGGVLQGAEQPVTITLLARWGTTHRATVPRAVRGRVLNAAADTREHADAALAGASAYLALPTTPARAVLEAAAAGLPVYDVEALTPTVIDELVAGRLTPRAHPALLAPAQLASEHHDVYAALRGLVHAHIPRSADMQQRSCVIDLHMHTSHSWDCAVDPEALMYVAREVGLTAIAVTDHNEISGALACAALADEYGVQVIVGEEVKTAEGEVIGLFLNERIEPGLGWHETIALIRAQDGLVYVPHPFDRMHTIPDVHLLRESLEEIDAFETYHARLAFDQYNRDAERFARKYNLVEGAGSDAHVVQGLGTAAVHMPAWDDPESFMVALAQGEIHRRPKNLLYLQGLKWVNDLTGRSRRSPHAGVDQPAS
jgi:predicted metal-dependent phosphoesterase TrpH